MINFNKAAPIACANEQNKRNLQDTYPNVRIFLTVCVTIASREKTL